jgi:hypothetical protein
VATRFFQNQAEPPLNFQLWVGHPLGKQLNDTKKWHSHGYGISMEVLQRDLKLVIDDFGKDAAISNAVRSYHDLLSDYMVKRDTQGVVHVCNQYRPFM